MRPLPFRQVRYDAVSYRAFKFNWKPEAFTLDTDTLKFQNVSYTQPAVMEIELNNNLQEDIEINYVNKHTDYFDIVNQMPVSIPANSTKTFTVKFIPNGAAGIFDDILTFCWDRTGDNGLHKRIAVQLPVIAETVQGVNTGAVSNMTVFPNPFRDKIIINPDETIQGKIFVSLFDGVGREVLKTDFVAGQQFTIPANTLSKGFYTLMVSYKNGFFVKKIIKK